MRRYIRLLLLLLVVGLLTVSPVFTPSVQAATPTAGTVNKPQVNDPATNLPAKLPLLTPAAPTNLAVTVLKTQVDLSWQDASGGAARFKIERKTGANSQYAEIKAVGPGITKFGDTTVLAGTAYSYRVKAVLTKGDKEYSSPYSNEASVTIPVKVFTPLEFTTGQLSLIGKPATVEFTIGQLSLIGKPATVEFTIGQLSLIGKPATVEFTTGRLSLIN